MSNVNNLRQLEITNCERRYFRVYTFSRISENWQFRADLISLFIYFFLLLCSMIKVIFTLYIFSPTFDKRE